MLALYLAALVVAVGVFVVQFAFGHHDADTAVLAHDVSHDGDGSHDSGAWSLIASVRFWSFALLAFGLVGTLLTLFGFAGPITTAVLAGGMGVGSGAFAAVTVRRLLRGVASSHASSSDAIGRMGRVIVPPDAQGTCKVRVDLKGSHVDYVGRAKEPLEIEDAVIVEEIDGGELVVSRAPKELKA